MVSAIFKIYVIGINLEETFKSAQCSQQWNRTVENLKKKIEIK